MERKPSPVNLTLVTSDAMKSYSWSENQITVKVSRIMVNKDGVSRVRYSRPMSDVSVLIWFSLHEQDLTM